MSQNHQVRLKKSSILSVPIECFSKDFSFIVNGEEFKTSHLFADLLSKKICQMHTIDPTCNMYILNTKNNGDFSKFLNLINFQSTNFVENELPFFLEIIDILGTNSLEISDLLNYTEITKDKVFPLINKHQKYGQFYSKILKEEISFVSSHFFELCEEHENLLIDLNIRILQCILNDTELKINDEDQLLRFINKLYVKDINNSILYENVIFSNVSKEGMTDFVSFFDINDITVGIWRGLTERLTNNEEKMNSNRYKNLKEKADLPYKENQTFSGIIKYLKDKQLNKIEDEINITHSSVRGNGQESSNVVLYERDDKYFCSKNLQNSWICFEFKNHQVILTDYIIKTTVWNTNWNPKSWIVEGSLDGNTWDTLDEQKDCPYLKENNCVHKFTVSSQSSKSYRFIRFSQTGPNWADSYHFSLKRLELYGNIITLI